MIAIINYGSGNIRAIENVYSRLSVPARIVNRPEELAGAKKILLPGVGAFDHTMELLEESGFRGALENAVEEGDVYVLGICVGMQILGRGSEEGNRCGLGWIDGVVRRIDVSRLSQVIQLPHMGWNDVCPKVSWGLFKQMDQTARFYFLHSYYFVPDREESVLATSDYAGNFACAVGSGRIFGVQFHPEKSHRHGIQLLKNFADL